ncbi:MAG: sugar phosphate isomerase/epimerase [Chloroflexota bacterium]
MQTRTGGFPIGFRRGWSEWQQDINALIEWTKNNDLSVIDLGKNGDTEANIVRGAGLVVGSIDMAEWQGMISADAGKRAEAIAQNSEYVRACANPDGSPTNFFQVMLPENPELSRSENFGYMVESYNELSSVLEENNGRMVIEGWPGPGALCCTPEGYRALFEQCPSPSIGVNYDPSHLVRMGIDPIRFLGEFMDRVYHVHGKDTEILEDAQYEYGTEQPATFAKPIWFGAHHWRYTIPGQGNIRWVKIFEMLAEHGYNGAVSIELEDANFNGSTETEQQGLLLGAAYLAGC